MKKIKKFQSFNESFGRLSDYLNSVVKKGGDFAQNVWDVTKVESKETKIAVEILSRMIKGEEVSQREKEFVKRQSGDIARILPLVAISGLPIPIPITPLLVVLGKKYGFDFLPKDHRAILANEVELPEDLKSLLLDIPETGMGYHIVDVALKNGRVLKNRKIINCSKILLNPDEIIDTVEIEDICTTID